MRTGLKPLVMTMTKTRITQTVADRQSPHLGARYIQRVQTIHGCAQVQELMSYDLNADNPS